MCRLITQHSKVRATVKDDGHGKDIVNVICNVCRDGIINSRGYSTVSASREHRAKWGDLITLQLDAPAVCEGCN